MMQQLISIRVFFAIGGKLFLAVIATNAFAAAVGGDDSFALSANAAVDRVAQDDGFYGAILIARGNRVLLRKAVGFSDRARNIRNTPDTKFPIESVTKQFTATAILLLIQDGKLSLSDNISKYYPGIPVSWRNITIQNLLTHSSGIVDCKCAISNFQSYKDYVTLSENDPLAFTPGAGFLYSNTGYALLTAVIERVSGQSYASFMNSRIFSPLGMHNTGYGGHPRRPRKRLHSLVIVGA
jgi:CubicO group peptidase (beta-lactamase class C family)